MIVFLEILARSFFEPEEKVSLKSCRDVAGRVSPSKIAE